MIYNSYLRLHLIVNSSTQKNNYTGIALAILAVLIWSGNFIAARGVIKDIPPVSLAFYRWLLASVILLPFVVNRFRREWPSIKSAWHYLFWVALTGVALFNTFVYIGAHYTSAINLALIGTTSSPIMSIIFARIFLKEPIGWMKLIGLAFCIVGVLFLLSSGNLQNLFSHAYSAGDLWVLAAAFCFAVYNTLVKKKPSSISPINFLFVAFAAGTLMLLPFFIWEINHTAPVKWDIDLFLVILYLGLGASVICFLIWNIAISKIGTGRTALFGNLIPVFTSIEAVLFLHEEFTWVHVVSMIIVFTGILLANFRLLR
jgi:drug/metabolite transporter (DMT)-like permease